MKRWWPRSLFGKLLTAQIVNIVILSIVLPVILSHTLAATADNFVAGRLSRVAGLIAQHATAPQDELDHLGRTLPPQRNGRSFALFDSAGKVIARSTAPLPPGAKVPPHGTTGAFARQGQFDVLTRPIFQGDRLVGHVIVAQDRTVPDEIVDDVVDDFLRRFLWVLPVMLLASLALSLIVLRRVTGNFRRATSQADAIGLARLDARIDETQLPSEAAPLVRATNRAIDRLEAGYHAQGEFVGNVAHELRTPLALLSLHTEQLPASRQRDQLQSDIEKANHVVRQLMELAAIDRLHPECRAIHSTDVAREVVETMVPIVYRSGHSIALEIPDTVPPPVQAVRELLVIALTNIVDNAVRHTPQGCAITVIVESEGSLVVEDDGPGIEIDTGAVGVRRFRRGDAARTDSAGLGISIVERIMRVCGGALEVSRAAGGGARLRLRLVPVKS